MADRLRTRVGYAQIEKECLAIVFSLERFHQYTFGRVTVVQSDHKPLETIVKKPLHKAPKRIQAMPLRLLQYDVVVKYTKGSALHIADALSRAYVANGSNEGRHFSQINTVVHLPIGQTTMKLLRAATAADDDMQALKQTILEGWPESKVDINAQTSAYFGIPRHTSASAQADDPGRLAGEQSGHQRSDLGILRHAR